MSASDNTTTEPVDRAVEIERLAALDLLDYEVARDAAAKRLNLRASVLDTAVSKKRKALGLDSESDDGQGRKVRFVDVMPWDEPVDGDTVATTLAAAVKTYAVVPGHAADTIALWVLHTWVVDRFYISPRLAVTSPTKGCGKTTILRILKRVARRPKSAGSISPAALFRAVEAFKPTMLLDETEKYVEHGSELHALINEGHLKGATALRVLGEKNELREFDIFGAVAFGRNGKLPDDIEQRSITIEMQRRRPDESLAELRDDRCQSLLDLARQCARWADDVYLDGADPDMGDIINRVADNWRPLFAIADAIGSDWPQRARDAAKALTPRDADSFGTTLLNDIKTVFDAREGEWADRMFSETLAEALAAIEGSRWAEYGKARKPITKNQLAQLLKGFKVTPDSVRIGTKQLKGYHRHQFEDVWTRYLPQGVPETYQRTEPTAAGTSTPFQNVPEEAVGTAEKCEKPLSPSGCSVGTFQEGEKAPGGDEKESIPLVCERCGDAEGPGDPVQEYLVDGDRVPLHPRCEREWLGEDLDIPECLRRSAP